MAVYIFIVEQKTGVCSEYRCSFCCQLNGEGDQNADGEDWRSVMKDDTAKTPIRHYQLEGLKPNKRYKLIVRAQNGFGWSDYSEEFIFRTAPGELN